MIGFGLLLIIAIVTLLSITVDDSLLKMCQKIMYKVITVSFYIIEGMLRTFRYIIYISINPTNGYNCSIISMINVLFIVFYRFYLYEKCNYVIILIGTSYKQF